MSPVDLSIIIPIYNAEKYLKKCLDSVLHQTFQNIEVICVNDCSKDRSLEILNSYALKDSRLKIINNETNLGPGANRNIGIKKSQGKYITFIDADDFYLHNDCLSLLMSKVLQNNLDLIIFNHQEYDEERHAFIDNDLKRFGFPYGKKEIDHLWSEAKIEEHYFGITPFPWNKIYSKSMLIDNEIFFPEGIYYEDAVFSNYVSLFCKRVMIDKNQYYGYRVNVATSTTSNIMAKFDSIIAMHKEMFAFLKQRNIYDKYELPFVRLCMRSLCWYFLPQINDIKKAKELNEQIAEFVDSLCIAEKVLRQIAKEDYYIADLIVKYQKSQYMNLKKEMQITFLNYLFKICGLYTIQTSFFIEFARI